MPKEEPIIRLTDQEHLRAKILEGRAAGDQRWQQKWDDLDAFPYGDTVQHQAEYLAQRPMLVRLLSDASQKAAPAPARAPAPKPLPSVQKHLEKVAIPPTAQVDPRAGAAQSGLDKWMPKPVAKHFGGASVPAPPMRPDMGAPPSQAPSRYVPPPQAQPMDFRPQLQQFGLDKWMPPQQADLFRKR